MSENKQPNGVVPGNVVLVMIISLIIGCGIESMSETTYGGWITVFAISGVLLLIWLILHSNPKIARFVRSFYDVRTKVEMQKEREAIYDELGLETPLEKQKRKKKQKTETDQLNEQKKLDAEEQKVEDARIKLENDTKQRKIDVENTISNYYKEKNISEDYKLVEVKDEYFDLTVKWSTVKSKIKAQVVSLAEQQLAAEQAIAMENEDLARQKQIHGGEIDYDFNGVILDEKLPLDDSGKVYFKRPHAAMDKEMKAPLSNSEYQRLKAFAARLDPEKHQQIVEFCHNRDYGKPETDDSAAMSVQFDYKEKPGQEGENSGTGGSDDNEGFEIEVKN